MPKEPPTGRSRGQTASSPILRVWLTRRAELERVCLHWTRGCRSDAEDLLSEALARALEAAADPQEVASPRAWLATIIANLGRDRWRRAVSEVPLDVHDSGDDELVPERAFIDEAIDVRRQLLRALGAASELPSAQRHILLRRCLGETYADIARSLNISEGLARKLVHEARGYLRAREAWRQSET